jgi:uncharacterized glyoxalase superfamily protein PhnB
MNKSNQLLALLDRVFGFQNKIRSTFRKHSQDFDEKTNEHVVLIEYRVSVKGTMKSAPRRKQQPNQMAMIQQLLAQQNQSKTKKK